VIAAKHWLTVWLWLASASTAKEAEAAKIRVLEDFLVWFAGFLKIIRIRCHSRPLRPSNPTQITTFNHFGPHPTPKWLYVNDFF